MGDLLKKYPNMQNYLIPRQQPIHILTFILWITYLSSSLVVPIWCSCFPACTVYIPWCKATLHSIMSLSFSYHFFPYLWTPCLSLLVITWKKKSIESKSSSILNLHQCSKTWLEKNILPPKLASLKNKSDIKWVKNLTTLLSILQ